MNTSKAVTGAVTDTVATVGEKFALPPMDDDSVARRAAAEKLEQAMPSMFQPASIEGLTEAIEHAKKYDVDADKIAAAEEALEKLKIENEASNGAHHHSFTPL